MLRLSSLLVFAAFLACGLAQTTTTAEATTTEAKATTTEAKATTTEAKATTTEAKATTTEAKPTTPEAKPTDPPTSPIGNYSYSENGTVCMTVIGNMTWNVTYDDGTETPAYKNVSLLNHIRVSDDNSNCSSKTIRTLAFEFEYPEDEADPHFITITFKNGSNAWNASEVVYTFNTDAYPNLNVSNPGVKTFKATSSLFETNVDPGYSYSCGNAQLTFNSSAINYTLNATLYITHLQVQAFHTDKMTDGSLGAPQDCASGKGNKIVPIAVGAALAGLVIVVLIAYLIGRLKSRKQSSYEALS